MKEMRRNVRLWVFCGWCISYFPVFLLPLSLLASHWSVWFVLQSLGSGRFCPHATQSRIVPLHDLMPHNVVRLNALLMSSIVRNSVMNIQIDWFKFLGVKLINLTLNCFCDGIWFFTLSFKIALPVLDVQSETW